MVPRWSARARTWGGITTLYHQASFRRPVSLTRPPSFVLLCSALELGKTRPQFTAQGALALSYRPARKQPRTSFQICEALRGDRAEKLPICAVLGTNIGFSYGNIGFQKLRYLRNLQILG